MKNKWLWILLICIVLVGVILFVFRVDEDTWIQDGNGNWQRYGNPSEPAPEI